MDQPWQTFNESALNWTYTFFPLSIHKSLRELNVNSDSIGKPTSTKTFALDFILTMSDTFPVRLLQTHPYHFGFLINGSVDKMISSGFIVSIIFSPSHFPITGVKISILPILTLAGPEAA